MLPRIVSVFVLMGFGFLMVPHGASAANPVCGLNNGQKASGFSPKNQYFILYDKFVVNQRKWTGQKVRLDAIYKIVAETGMSRQTFDSCVANQKITDGLVWVKNRARQFGVFGTPTFFVNGKKASGALTFDQIKAMISSEAL